METKSKIISFIGLAKKAAKLSIGKDATYESILENTAELILFSSDLSTRSINDVEKSASKRNVKTLMTNISMSDYEQVLNKKAGIICIKDSGFAKKIQMLCEIQE